MKNLPAILRWWMIVFSIFTGAMVLQEDGVLFPYLLEVDHSRLTLLNLGLFLFVTPFVGWLTYNICIKGQKQYVKHLDACHFAANSLMAIGMMGTLVGFMMMFSENMAHIDTSNVDTVKQVVVQMSRGFSTGIVTTLVGVITSTLLKLQLVNLENAIEE